jgi:FkbM family methyltransferase
MALFTLDDITLDIPDEVLGDNVRRALEKGQFEHGEARALRRHFTDADRLLELGSGTGYLGSIAAKIAGPQAVTGVEALPRMVEVARANLARNGAAGVTLHWGAAVPDDYAQTHVQFDARPEFWASSILSPLGKRKPITIDVPALRIGTLLRESRATVLSCDIEGGELALFDAPLPADLRLVIMEIHPNVYGNAGTRRVFDALSAQGFAYYPYGSMAAVVVFSREAK